MNNEVRNIIININILDKQLKKITMSDEERQEINFQMERLVERVEYLLDDILKDTKYIINTTEENKKIIEELKKEM